MGCLLNISGSGLSYFDYGGAFAKELEDEGSQAQKHFTIVQLKSIFLIPILSSKFILDGPVRKKEMNLTR